MSNLLLLGGNSIRNQIWIKKVEEQLASLFDETIIYEYQHWLSGEGSMNIEKEMNLLYSHIKDDKDVVVFAKSLGTVLAMKVMIDQGFLPKKCIFVGLPLGYIRNMGFSLKTYLSKITCPVLFIQNKEDPAGSYLEVVGEVSQISNNFSFVELPGNDHDYSNIEALGEIISNCV